MMFKASGVIILFLCFAIQELHTQDGAWQSYSDMKEIRGMVQVGETLWAATNGGVFTFNQTTGEYSRYTNVNGLHSIDMRSIAVDRAGRVIVGAGNGAINVYTPGKGWTSVLDIYRATDRSKRAITVLRVRGDVVYVGTEFGITVYNLDRGEFRDSYLKFGSLPSQTAVQDIFFHNDSLWVATLQGVAVADLKKVNLQDPQNWKSFSQNDGLPSLKVSTVAELHRMIMIGTDRGAAVYRDGSWYPSLPAFGQSAILKFFPYQNGMYLTLNKELFNATSNENVAGVGEYLGFSHYPSGAQFTDVIVGGNKLLVGTTVGFSFYEEGERWNFSKPNGPTANKFLSLTVDDTGKLWSASGRDGAGVGTYSFDGEVWTNYTKDSNPELMTNEVFVVGRGVERDMWFGTWGNGLAHRFEDGTFENFNTKNTNGFPGIPSDAQFSPISGIAPDSRGNMWFLHSSTSGSILSSYSADKKWHFFRSQLLQGALTTSSLTVDHFGTKWMIVDETAFRGLLLFNDNGTLDNPFDDMWTKVDASDQNGLAASRILSIAVDKLGDVWIGTDIGLRTIFNPRTPDRISRTCFNTRCNIEGQVINCIAIDPVNNKWIGTNSGVFVLSADGSTIIEQFSTENSPLLDNNVRTIAIHPQTGVAYIGTTRGLSSVTTPYIQPLDAFTELKVSPNPFRPGIDEVITVRGLVEGSSLKILSVSGSVIADVQTPGGQIGKWDGRTSDGSFAPSGVYFIVAYSPDGGQSSVAKVTIVRP